ncbi:hypothetical protein DSO57_1011102 [Entomophthora muscae]|uniref:Uncharacterized protein n=1 Tax=Entomophthora muscae TaxID=34485 RepID=A0ACC2T6M2_9FUNG|nr:hypothetical protein DSO57_1011102 [Entomophthora muscae]
MRGIVINICLTVVTSFGVYTVNQGDDPFNSYVKGAEYVGSQEKGYLKNMITSLPCYDALPFVAEDYEKLGPLLEDPANLRPLMVDNKVAFNVNGLSVSPKEAEESLLTLSDQIKDKISERIKEAIHYKAKLPSQAEVTQRIHATLDRMSQVDDLEGEFVKKAHATFTAHPEYAQYINILISALPTTFDHEVLGYLEEFFAEANTYDCEDADKLRSAIAKIQKEYSIFPDPYYQKLNMAIARPDNAIPAYSR